MTPSVDEGRNNEPGRLGSGVMYNFPLWTKMDVYQARGIYLGPTPEFDIGNKQSSLCFLPCLMPNTSYVRVPGKQMCVIFVCGSLVFPYMWCVRLEEIDIE